MAAEVERGVIYLPSLPPYMNHKRLRKYFTEMGAIDRIHLTPEPTINHILRKRCGGNTRKNFVEAWVEFLDKQEAKRAALLYNNAVIGGKKRHNFYRDDRWMIRYLPKFKWEHLSQKIQLDLHTANSQVREEASLSRKQNRFFAKQVEQSRQIEGIKRKREASGTVKEPKKKIQREFPQRTPID